MNLAETQERKQVEGHDERQTIMGNCGKSWKVDKPRDSGFKSDRDRQAGRQMARAREWWANSQRSRQTTREKKKLPASEGGADRPAGRHHNRSEQVERQAEARREDKSGGHQEAKRAGASANRQRRGGEQGRELGR